jgi:hypothetical protein
VQLDFLSAGIAARGQGKARDVDAVMTCSHARARARTGLSGWPLVFLTGVSVAYVSYAAHRRLKSDIAVDWKAGGLERVEQHSRSYCCALPNPRRPIRTIAAWAAPIACSSARTQGNPGARLRRSKNGFRPVARSAESISAAWRLLAQSGEQHFGGAPGPGSGPPPS